MVRSVVLLGHGAGVKFTIDSLLRNPTCGYRVKALVTHPKQEHQSDLQMLEKRKELYGEFGYNVFDVEKDYGIDLLEAVDVNDHSVVEWIKSHDPAYVISIGCRNIIKQAFLKKFEGCVLNIHTTPLPRYRGAANDSWMILNGEWGTEQYGCIHFIDEGIDTGAIIAKSFYRIPDRCYPIDLYKVRLSTFKDLLLKGLENLKDKNFVPELQVRDQATTFPRLFTPTDGRIDFRYFKGDEILRFIYAFGYPFEGAHCFIGETKINILEADFQADQSFHPFANGLIFGKNARGEYKVVVNGGYLLLKSIEYQGVQVVQSKFLRLGKFFS